MKKNTIISVITLMFCTKMLWASAFNFSSANPEAIMTFIQGNNAYIYLSTFFGLGLLLAFTPCVLPMVPILSGIIVGQKDLSASKAFKLSLSYVLGMSFTYALAGMLAGFMGSTVQTLMQRPSIIIFFAFIFLMMALSMFGLFDIKVPASWSNKFTRINQQGKGHNYISVAVMGILSTLVVSPCVTAPLIGVLSYIGQNGDVAMGGLILFVMSLGMGIPLLLVGLGYGSFLPKTGMWMIKIKQLFGFIMLAMAIWMLSRVVDAKWICFIWASLFVAISLYLFNIQAKQRRLVVQFIGLVALIYSGVLVQKGIQLNEASDSKPTITVHKPFISVNTLAAIQVQLDKARQEKKMVMIEFFATWCSDCQGMETKVFNQSEIINALSPIVSLKVDVSQKTTEVDRIRNTFGVFGYPTILFFDSQGKALKEITGVGFIPMNSMLELINKAKETALS